MLLRAGVILPIVRPPEFLRPLTPVALFEGKIAASNMLKGKRAEPDYTSLPSVVFAIPELTQVGQLEEEARERGMSMWVSTTPRVGSCRSA